MGAIGSPNPSLAPNPNDIITTFPNNNNCFREICSTSCPQWCIIPPSIDDANPTVSFSPLIIALITILTIGFLLILYYFFLSKYCHRRRTPPDDHPIPTVEYEAAEETLNRQIFSGLDEGSIGSITVFKYSRGDGLVESTECAVCLSEFKEDERLRLLPNCSHAFHVNCIDVWLKSHSNCPLCRADGDPFLPPPGRGQPPSHQVYAI